MYSERGLDDWTRNETSHPGRLGDEENDENEDQTIADIVREQQEDKKRAEFIRSLQGNSDTKETTIYFTKRKVGKW